MPESKTTWGVLIGVALTGTSYVLDRRDGSSVAPG